MRAHATGAMGHAHGSCRAPSQGIQVHSRCTFQPIQWSAIQLSPADPLLRVASAQRRMDARKDARGAAGVGGAWGTKGSPPRLARMCVASTPCGFGVIARDRLAPFCATDPAPWRRQRVRQRLPGRRPSLLKQTQGSTKQRDTTTWPRSALAFGNQRRECTRPAFMTPPSWGSRS